MNKVIISGNLTRDPEVRYTTGEKSTAYARFNVACQRKYKNDSGGYDADFPTVTAWGNNAEFVSKFFHKGSRIEVAGELRTGSYINKDGVKVYTTEVLASEVGFGGGSSSAGQHDGNDNVRDDSFMNIPDSSEEKLPFN